MLISFFSLFFFSVVSLPVSQQSASQVESSRVTCAVFPPSWNYPPLVPISIVSGAQWLSLAAIVYVCRIYLFADEGSGPGYVGHMARPSPLCSRWSVGGWALVGMSVGR
ncbi:hypothetical protein F4815DRAFT_12549 [Daldinia loculata]|nr:hypothetical protein F4815DRAFT_12549 [Daldinia loculata]